MLTSQTSARILIARNRLRINPTQLRLKAEEMVFEVQHLPEAAGQTVADELEQIVKELRANEAALILNGATVGGSRVAELEAQP